MDAFNYVKPVMPVAYCREDGVWIQEMLGKLPRGQREKIAHEYAELYQAKHDAEPISFKQENAGRREANKHLRLNVERYARANQGMTSPPPLAPVVRVAA